MENQPENQQGAELATQPPDDPVKNTMLNRMQEQFRQYAGANLKIQESGFIIVDERGGIEYRCFTEEDAMELAQERVQNVGGIHTIFKRVAVVRPPKAEFIVERE